MQRSLGHIHKRARSRLDRLLAADEHVFPFEDVESFVLGVMDMRRWPPGQVQAFEECIGLILLLEGNRLAEYLEGVPLPGREVRDISCISLHVFYPFGPPSLTSSHYDLPSHLLSNWFKVVLRRQFCHLGR